MLWSISVTLQCYSFQSFATVFSTTENLLVGISGDLGIRQKAIFSAKMMFWENPVEYLRNSQVL